MAHATIHDEHGDPDAGIRGDLRLRHSRPGTPGQDRPPGGAGTGRHPAQADHAKAKAADPARMEWLLKQWEKQSSLLKTLDVTILRIDNNPAWDDLEYYEGRALFKSPNLAFINFEKIKQDENKKPIKDPTTRIQEDQVRDHALRADHLHRATRSGSIAATPSRSSSSRSGRTSRRRRSRRGRCRSSST